MTEQKNAKKKKVVRSTTYAQLDLQSVGLLTKQQILALSSALWDTYLHFWGLLSDFQAFGLAQSNSIGEDKP